MALIVPIGARSLPAAGDTVSVYLTGTETLATGLVHWVTGAALENPIPIPAAPATHWGFVPADASPLDIYWDDSSKLLVQSVVLLDTATTVTTDGETTSGTGTEIDPVIVVTNVFQKIDNQLDHEAITGPIDISANKSDHIGTMTIGFTGTLKDFAVLGKSSIKFDFTVSGSGTPTMTLYVASMEAIEAWTTLTLIALADGDYRLIILYDGTKYGYYLDKL